MEIIFLIIGILIGVIVTWLVFRSNLALTKGIPQEEVDGLKNQINNLTIELSKSEVKNKLVDENLKKASDDLNLERAKVIELNSLLSSLKSNYSNLQNKLEEQKSEVEKLQEKFTKEFENLANKILDEKSSKFTQQNKDNLDQILKPLNDKIKDFEKKVEDVYVNESKDRAGLRAQIMELVKLNQQVSAEATNLTNALKGQSKTQGNWGEFIL